MCNSVDQSNIFSDYATVVLEIGTGVGYDDDESMGTTVFCAQCPLCLFPNAIAFQDITVLRRQFMDLEVSRGLWGPWTGDESDVFSIDGAR